MNHIICKTKDHEMVIDMALIGDGRCAAFIVGGAGPVIVGRSWRKVGGVCLKLAA